MASVNKVILVGNLGADPEVRYLPSGDAVANIRLATTDRYKDKASGDFKEMTEWHRVAILNEHIVKVVESSVEKGSSIYVEGQLQTRKWTDQQGVEKYSTEIVVGKFNGQLTLLGGRSDGGERSDTSAG